MIVVHLPYNLLWRGVELGCGDSGVLPGLAVSWHLEAHVDALILEWNDIPFSVGREGIRVLGDVLQLVCTGVELLPSIHGNVGAWDCASGSNHGDDQRCPQEIHFMACTTSIQDLERTSRSGARQLQDNDRDGMSEGGRAQNRLEQLTRAWPSLMW